MATKQTEKKKLTPEKKKKIKLSENERALFNVIFKNNEEGIKAAAAAKEAGIERTTALGYVDNMVDKELIYADNDKMLHVNGDFGYMLGCSFGKGETVICLELADFTLASKAFINDLLDGDALKFLDAYNFTSAVDGNEAIWRTETPNSTLQSLADMVDDIGKFVIALDHKINMISLSICFGDHVNNLTKTFVRSRLIPDYPMFNQDIPSTLFSSRVLHQLTDRGITLNCDHNAKAALICERNAQRGVLNPNKIQVGSTGIAIYMGTGLGSALVAGFEPGSGHLIRSDDNGAGCRFGHLKVLSGEDCKGMGTCSCGLTDSGCLEQAVKRIFAGDKDDEGIDFKKASGKEIRTYLENHPEKNEQFVELLSRAIITVCDIINCSFVCFTGRISSFSKVFERQLNLKLIPYNNTIRNTNLKVLYSEIGPNAAAIGMGMIAFFNWLGEEID